MQIEHKTEKGTVLFFLPPNEADRFKFFNDEEPYLSYFIGHETFRKRFQKGTVLIGLTSEVIEEQAKMIGLASVSNFRKEIEKLQVYEVNPLDKPNRYLACKLHPLECTGDEINRCRKYEEAQSRTGKWIVLFKPND